MSLGLSDSAFLSRPPSSSRGRPPWAAPVSSLSNQAKGRDSIHTF